MSQYPFIFIGSIVAILLINIGCKPTDTGTQEESLLLEDVFRDVPTHMVTGKKSSLFYLSKNRQKRNIQTKNLKYLSDQVFSMYKDGEYVDIPPKLYPTSHTSPHLFYFDVPQNYPTGNYVLKLHSKSFPSINKTYKLKIVNQNQLTPAIHSLRIKSLQEFKSNDNFNIPISKCINLFITVHHKNNKVAYNITKEMLDDININSVSNNFTVNEDMKICAFRVENSTTLFPTEKEKVTLKIKYRNLERSVNLIIVKNPEATEQPQAKEILPTYEHLIGKEENNEIEDEENNEIEDGE